MATKTANVMARVEPQIKEQAEKIMEMLGIPFHIPDEEPVRFHTHTDSPVAFSS